ncbi:MAG: PqqD family protein [Candidatus Aminicenantales bacterium]
MAPERFIVKNAGEEGVVVYDTKQDTVHFLNRVAFHIWTCLQEGKSYQEIERELRKNFEPESEEDIPSDIEKCVKELKQKELI